jgi:hypothetical protein
MTTNLREAAAAADAERRASDRDRARERREASLAATRERWSGQYAIGGRLDLPCPGADEFTWRADVPTEYASRLGSNRVSGWEVEIDGVRFLTRSHQDGGWNESGDWVLVTCPRCSCEIAYTFHDVATVGQLLRVGRGIGHKCRYIETREFAWALGRAMRETGLDTDALMVETLQVHGEEVWKVANR